MRDVYVGYLRELLEGVRHPNATLMPWNGEVRGTETLQNDELRCVQGTTFTAGMLAEDSRFGPSSQARLMQES